jgi:hypothetical protein
MPRPLTGANRVWAGEAGISGVRNGLQSGRKERPNRDGGAAREGSRMTGLLGSPAGADRGSSGTFVCEDYACRPPAYRPGSVLLLSRVLSG